VRQAQRKNRTGVVSKAKTTVSAEGAVSTVSTQGKVSTVSAEGAVSTVSAEGAVSTVSTEGAVSTVSTEGGAVLSTVKCFSMWKNARIWTHHVYRTSYQRYKIYYRSVLFPLF
jgi:hypothetical protein